MFVTDVREMPPTLVVEGSPSYSLLLGRHWMSSVKILGNYEEGGYTLVNDNGDRVKMHRTRKSAYRVESHEQPSTASTTSRPKWIVTEKSDNHPAYSLHEDIDDMSESELDRELLALAGDDSLEYEADSEDASGN